MKFIKLTSARGFDDKEIYLNSDYIVHVNLYSEKSFKGKTVTQIGTVPFTGITYSEESKSCFLVKETPEEILKLIEQAS
jgi:hypothetical protein